MIPESQHPLEPTITKAKKAMAQGPTGYLVSSFYVSPILQTGTFSTASCLIAFSVNLLPLFVRYLDSYHVTLKRQFLRA